MGGCPLRVVDRPSPNFGERADGTSIEILLLHYTGMTSAEAACQRLCDPRAEVSCHYLIDEAGNIVRLVPEAKRAWHAGVSSWRGRGDVNSRSIGVEIHNPGHDHGYRDFPAIQMTAVVELCADILSRHAIPPEGVLAHSDVAPGRKIDPGEKFDWAGLSAAGIGLWVEPSPPCPDEASCLAVGAEGDRVRALQTGLAEYGYGIEISGVYDQHTSEVVAAFQRHFRPLLVDGRADRSTLHTLKRLLLAAGRIT